MPASHARDNPVRPSAAADIDYPGKRAHALLIALAHNQYITIEQARRLLYGKSYGTTATAFKILETLGLVKFVWLPPDNRLGGARKVYTLTKKGIAYLADVGETGFENKSKNPFTLQHSLRITDFLISAQLLCKQDARFHLDKILHERILHDQLRTNAANQVTIHIKIRDGSIEAKMLSPILDALVIISTKDITCPIGLEIDMGTESEDQWQSKVAALVEWIRGPYRSIFQYHALTIAVVTTTASRLQQLRAWTTEELQTTGRARYTDVFVLTDAPPDSDPQTLFLTPFWQLANRLERIALIDEPTEGGEENAGAV